MRCRLVVLAMTLLSLVAWSASSFAHAPVPSEGSYFDAKRKELLDRYTKLQAAIEPAVWPDRSASDALWRGLHRGKDGTVQPNRFASDGPLQATVFFEKNPEALRVIGEARSTIFEPLVRDLCAGLRHRNKAIVERGLWIPKDGALHVIVRVFSEHPSLLDGDAARKWKPIWPMESERLGEVIEAALRAGVQGSSTTALILRLWGYTLTPDGSMLFLFEEGDGGTSLLALRDKLGRAGESVLGELNSRPKALIHLTAARLLEFPEASDLTEAESKHIRDTVTRWRALLRASGQARGAALPNIGRTIRVDELELVRDVHWFMTQRQVLRTFRLDR